MCAVAAGMDDPLGNALVVEVEDLLAKGEVLEQRRTALAGAQRILVVGYEGSLSGGHRSPAPVRRLLGLAPVPGIPVPLGGLVGRLGVGRGLEERRRRFLCHGSLRKVRPIRRYVIARRTRRRSQPGQRSGSTRVPAVPMLPLHLSVSRARRAGSQPRIHSAYPPVSRGSGSRGATVPLIACDAIGAGVTQASYLAAGNLSSTKHKILLCLSHPVRNCQRHRGNACRNGNRERPTAGCGRPRCLGGEVGRSFRCLVYKLPCCTRYHGCATPSCRPAPCQYTRLCPARHRRLRAGACVSYRSSSSGECREWTSWPTREL